MKKTVFKVLVLLCLVAMTGSCLAEGYYPVLQGIELTMAPEDVLERMESEPYLDNKKSSRRIQAFKDVEIWGRTAEVAYFFSEEGNYLEDIMVSYDDEAEDCFEEFKGVEEFLTEEYGPSGEEIFILWYEDERAITEAEYSQAIARNEISVSDSWESENEEIFHTLSGTEGKIHHSVLISYTGTFPNAAHARWRRRMLKMRMCSKME